MMKKIFALVLLLVLGKLSYSQYPLQQNLGSDSTIVISKGALQSRLIPIVVSDTTAANAQRMKTYPGAQLYTTNGNFYIRNANATKWVLISSGSVGPTNIYNSDGTLTGNRTLSGANNNLTFDNLNKFRVNTNDSVLYNTPNFNIKNLSGDLSVEGTVTGATSSLRLKTFEDGDWTIKTGRVGLELGDLRFYDNVNNPSSTRMIIKANGNVGVGTDSPDSLLTVAQGAYFQRGVRMSGLPTALGTKALRIDANGRLSVADTTLGGGTVTSVATNDGTGIKGGTITTSGTLYIDTTIISTVANVSGGLAGKLNISDTSNMLKDYFNSTGYGLTRSTQTILTDSATLSAYYLRRKDSLTATNPLGYVTKKVLADTAAAIRGADAGGTVTSVATNNGTGITGGTITTSGTLAIDTTIISTRAWRQKGVDSLQANINLKLNISDTASMLSPYLRSNTAAATYVPQTRTLTINGTTQDLSANRTYNVGTVTSVGLTMPAAFNVANSPVTGSGTLAVTGAGLASQYIRGDGTLANFPGGGGGGGASVSYYLNGSVNQGTFGGNTYYQMNKTPILGGGTNFTTNTNGYIAQFITNAGDPALLNIPAGNWNFELFFSASSGGGTPSYYVELYKYDGTTFTLIASGSSNPDVIINSAVDAYFSALPVPQTTLTLTDRLAVRIYVTPAGRTITLHTEDNNLCQVVTTFTTGITAINSLTAQVQYLTTGTSGTDFNISSLTDTHTFNLPVASGTNTGKLSNTDWTTFNNKIGPSDTASMLSPYLRSNVAAATYVPYNGAIASLDMGLYNVDAQNITSRNYVTGAAMSSITRSSILSNAYGMLYLRRTANGYLQPNNLTLDRNWFLPDTSGTLALRSELTGGTVTSVATNTNTGITGGTITTSGTLAIDTLLISTRAWRQKGVDSLQANINQKLNISDTASMLANYITGPQTFSGYMARFNGGGTVDTSRIFQNNGLVGINTTLPFYSLDVLGTGRVTSNTFLATSSGVVGIGTTSADSLLTVEQGAWIKRGVRMSGLPSAPGTRALRINANGTLSVADTLIDAGGTVTSVATNTGTGITGGTITTTGTLAIDTLLISTRAWRQKGVDSVASLVNTRISGTTNYIPKFTSSSAIGNSQIFDNGTSVGIATTSPDFPLTIQANTSANALKLLGRSLDNISILSFDNNANNSQYGYIAGIPTEFRTFTSNALTFYSGSSERMRLDASGNLNIATTGINNNFRLSIKSPTGNGGIVFQPDTDGSFVPVLRMLNAGLTTNVAEIGTASGTSFYISTNGTERARIDASGNLGLGTSSPAVNFQVAAASSPTIAMNLTGSATSGSRGDIAWFNSSISTVAAIRATAVTDNVGTQLEFYTRPAAGSLTQRLILDASGNLGLGVSPSAWNTYKAYQLPNGSFFSYPSPFSQTGIVLNGYNDGGWKYYSSDYASQYLQYNGEHRWSTAPSGTAGNAISFTQAMTLDASGRLGIGITSPTYKLDVSNAGNTVARFLNSQTGANADLVIGNGNNFWTQRITGDGTYDYTLINNGTGARILTALANGNVGIGTTSPNIGTWNQALTLNTASGNAAYELAVAGSAQLYLAADNSNAYLQVANTGSPLRIFTGGSERMRITSGGDLLIATTTDAGAYPLQVNGSVYATAYYESSDLRLKNVLSERQGSDGINTITFKWKDGRDSLTHIGYAAQQVEKVLPDAVKTNTDGYKTINYDEVQSLKIANLEQEIAELKKIIKQLIDKK